MGHVRTFMAVDCKEIRDNGGNMLACKKSTGELLCLRLNYF